MNNLELARQMIGTETTVAEFDYAMQMYGFYSEMDTLSSWIENGSVVYNVVAETADKELQVVVEFEVTISASEDEDESCSYIRIDGVEVC